MFRNKENSHYRHVSRNASFLRVFLLSLCRIELILQVPSNLTKVFYTKQTKYFLHTHASKEYSLQKLRRLSSSLLQAFFFPFPYSFSVRSTQHATIPKARFSANRLRRVREIDCLVRGRSRFSVSEQIRHRQRTDVYCNYCSGRVCSRRSEQVGGQRSPIPGDCPPRGLGRKFPEAWKPRRLTETLSSTLDGCLVS